MEYTRRTRGYWIGMGWVLGAYIILQFMYRMPKRFWPDIVLDHTIPPIWYPLFVVYLWVGRRLRQLDVRWIYALWHLSHFLLIVCAVAVLGYRKYFGKLPGSISSIPTTFTEFLISPVMYIALGLLYRAPRR